MQSQDKKNNDLRGIITEKLLDLNEQLAKYNELRNLGLSQDHTFEAIIDAKKQTLEELLKVIK